MKKLSIIYFLVVSSLLLGCRQSEPSDYSLKGAAAMMSTNSDLNYSGKTSFDQMQISQKWCTVDESGKAAICTFLLNGKRFTAQMILTGSGWAYREKPISVR